MFGIVLSIVVVYYSTIVGEKCKVTHSLPFRKPPRISADLGEGRGGGRDEGQRDGGEGGYIIFFSFPLDVAKMKKSDGI